MRQALLGTNRLLGLAAQGFYTQHLNDAHVFIPKVREATIHGNDASSRTWAQRG